MRGKAKASLILAIDGIRRKGCAAAGVRLAGQELSAICRLDLYGMWRLLTVSEAPDRCILLMVAEHTRTANPYQLLYDALGIGVPEEPRTKPACCDPEGRPPIEPDPCQVLRGRTSATLSGNAGHRKGPQQASLSGPRTWPRRIGTGHQQPMPYVPGHQPASRRPAPGHGEKRLVLQG